MAFSSSTRNGPIDENTLDSETYLPSVVEYSNQDHLQLLHNPLSDVVLNPPDFKMLIHKQSNVNYTLASVMAEQSKEKLSD